MLTIPECTQIKFVSAIFYFSNKFSYLTWLSTFFLKGLADVTPRDPPFALNGVFPDFSVFQTAAIWFFASAFKMAFFPEKRRMSAFWLVMQPAYM